MIAAIQRLSAILRRPFGLIDLVTRGQSRKEVAQGAAIQKLATILRHPSGLVDPITRGSAERRLLKAQQSKSSLQYCAAFLVWSIRLHGGNPEKRLPKVQQSKSSLQYCAILLVWSIRLRGAVPKGGCSTKGLLQTGKTQRSQGGAAAAIFDVPPASRSSFLLKKYSKLPVERMVCTAKGDTPARLLRGSQKCSYASHAVTDCVSSWAKSPLPFPSLSAESEGFLFSPAVPVVFMKR